MFTPCSRLKARLSLLSATLCATLLLSVSGYTDNAIGTVKVIFTSGHPANIFIPSQTLGAGIDGHDKGDLDKMLRPANVRAMRSVALKPLTYRLRTELGIEAWHWNPKGAWSDAAHQDGYWTSDSNSQAPVDLSYGYRLPRRGSTIDQANNDGYSRLDDGHPSTFWKSNPYLDEHYTGEDNSLHPQWAVIDFGKELAINTIRILWATPYALRYEVEFGGETVSEEFLPRQWKTFENGTVNNGTGGETLLRLAKEPVKARFIRVLMSQGSLTAPQGSKDVRDRLGYAIREIYAGVTDSRGQFHDLVRHVAHHKGQTVFYTSSTDPWHRAIDRDENTEQPGFDRVFRIGLTNGMSMLTPVPVLYDTPENVAAEIRFLQTRGYPVERIEMGEEPDGQLVTPEDYSALYMQQAETIHKVNPQLKLGGPSFASLEAGSPIDPEAPTTKRWMNRFLSRLSAAQRLGDFNFFSFEWYPFDEVCEQTAPQLAEAPELLSKALEDVRAVLPSGTPMLITEYGYSAYAGRAEVSIEGALLNADAVGLFLSLGGEQAYLYGYEPNELINDFPCSWGNNMLFMMDDSGHITHRLATYWGALMLTKDWAQTADEPLEVYRAETDIFNEQGQPLVTAYALRRPDGTWALMLINKDSHESHPVHLQIVSPSNTLSLDGPMQMVQFSPAEYVWHAEAGRGYPQRSRPPKRRLIPAGENRTYLLPAFSLTVLNEARN